jgi:hypothetical protein
VERDDLTTVGIVGARNVMTEDRGWRKWLIGSRDASNELPQSSMLSRTHLPSVVFPTAIIFAQENVKNFTKSGG